MRIFAKKLDCFITVAYILATKKTNNIYVEVMNEIKNKHFELYDEDLKIKNFHSDFESGLVKAMNFVFPYINSKKCWFHFCNAIRRYIQT